MIKGIAPAGKHIKVDAGSPGGLYFNSQPGQSMVGQLRYNPQSNNIEVYDGTSWISMPANYATVGLNMTAEEAIDWAIKKKQEEQELDELCKQHPSVAEAYERLQILKALTKTAESKSDSNT